MSRSLYIFGLDALGDMGTGGAPTAPLEPGTSPPPKEPPPARVWAVVGAGAVGLLVGLFGWRISR